MGTGSLGSHRCKNKLSKEYRRFSSLLIDEKTVIDPSEDIFEFEETFMLKGLCLGITDILITHSHLGHFSISAIERLAKLRGRIRVFGGEVIGRELMETNGIEFVEILPFKVFNVGGYEAVALPSNHITDCPGEIAFNFFFKKNKSFFYGLDGGFINPLAWKVIKEVKPDLYILDCALGNEELSEGAIYHNGIEGALAIRNMLIGAGVAAEDTKFILSHLPSLKKRDIHEELTLATEDLPAVRIAYEGYYAAF